MSSVEIVARVILTHLLFNGLPRWPLMPYYAVRSEEHISSLHIPFHYFSYRHELLRLLELSGTRYGRVYSACAIVRSCDSGLLHET
jgi:hypothetical protein